MEEENMSCVAVGRPRGGAVRAAETGEGDRFAERPSEYMQIWALTTPL